MVNQIFKADPALSGFSLTLENTAIDGPLSRTVNMFAPESETAGGFYEGAAQGFVSDGPVVDLGGYHGLIASGHPNRIAVLNSFIRRNPCMISKVFISSSSAINFNYPVLLKKLSPFSSQGEDTVLRLIRAGGEDRAQANERTIETEIYLSDQEYLQVQIRNESSLTFHFEFAFFMNAAATFRQLMQQMKS